MQIGDRVLHQQTGHAGKIIGYGHQILDGVYLPTLVVRVLRGRERLNQKTVIEDLSSAWMQVEGG